MKNTKSCIAKELLAFAEKKITYLQAIKKNLYFLYDNIEKIENDEIIAQFKKQNIFMDQINGLDEKYQTLLHANYREIPSALLLIPTEVKNEEDLPIRFYILNQKLKEQWALLCEIAVINEKTKIRTKNIQDELKNKIKLIVRQKKIIDHYYSFGKSQTGIFFDYKEGKKA